MLRRVTLVITDVSKERSVSFIRVTWIGELGTTLAVASNRRTLRRNTKYQVHRFLSPWWRRRYVLPKRRFWQEPHGVRSQKTPFFLIKCFSKHNFLGETQVKFIYNKQYEFPLANFTRIFYVSQNFIKEPLLLNVDMKDLSGEDLKRGFVCIAQNQEADIEISTSA
jgi:hypothetical protein